MNGHKIRAILLLASGIILAGTVVLPGTAATRVLWKKRVDCNLRAVELQKIRERATMPASNDPSKKRVMQKDAYHLVLLDAQGRSEATYDLSRCKRIRMIATAYYPGDPLAWRDGTETYTGLRMQRGIVAVDPRIIPLKTRVYVSGYGYGYAADTGSAIIGNRIDLGVNNAVEEKAWMHRPVTVYILEKASTW